MFRPGDHIGPFELIQKIGRGAFGEVWLAEEQTAISSHRVALKLPNNEDVDLEAIRQEASVWEQVKGHPNILPVIRADIADGQIYLASEYAPDGSLNKWLKIHGGKAPDIESARQMMTGILAGLRHLHAKEIVHRDLKPENILLQAQTPRIADFGIARLIRSVSSSTAATGTPAYMAPECFYGTRSEKTDLWAAGVIFHQMLTGKMPFPQPDQVSIMNAILNGSPEIDSNLPDNLRHFFKRVFSKEPDQRFDSAAAMINELCQPDFASDYSSFVVAVGDDGDEQKTVVFPRPPNGINRANRQAIFAVAMSVVVLGGMWLAYRMQLAGSSQGHQTLNQVQTDLPSPPLSNNPISSVSEGTVYSSNGISDSNSASEKNPLDGETANSSEQNMQMSAPTSVGPVDVPTEPLPNVQYIGMITRTRSNNHTAYFVGNTPAPFGARVNDVLEGRFRLVEIAANSVVLEDISLGVRHKVPITKTSSAARGQDDRSSGSQFMPQDNGVVLVPVPVNPDANPATRPIPAPTRPAANTAQPPITVPTPKPMATPPPRTKTDATKGKSTTPVTKPKTGKPSEDEL